MGQEIINLFSTPFLKKKQKTFAEAEFSGDC